LSKAEIEALVKIRDGHRMIADAYDEYLETLAPQAGHPEAAKSYDIEKITWVPKQGDKGPYEQSDDINNHNHKELLKDLAAHKGKMTIGQFFVWTFQNGSTIGRKKRSF
jgi:hypothetical protein